MRTRLFGAGLALTAIIVAACSTTGGTGGTVDGTTWALTSYLVDGSATPVPAEVIVDATFTDGTVAGSAGCNRYTGSYTLDGAKLTFGAIASTQMACVGAASEVEAAYLAHLGEVRTFTATAETLTLFDDAGASLLVYGVQQPGTLTGVTWHATGINNGQGGVEPVVAGTDPTATFDEAGTVSGGAGCNQYNGPAVVDGDSIAIGPLISTKMACVDEAASAQETAFLAALEAATTVTVRGSTLELRDASGALQVSFEAR